MNLCSNDCELTNFELFLFIIVQHQSLYIFCLLGYEEELRIYFPQLIFLSTQLFPPFSLPLQPVDALFLVLLLLNEGSSYKSNEYTLFMAKKGPQRLFHKSKREVLFCVFFLLWSLINWLKFKFLIAPNKPSFNLEHSTSGHNVHLVHTHCFPFFVKIFCLFSLWESDENAKAILEAMIED